MDLGVILPPERIAAMEAHGDWAGKTTLDYLDAAVPRDPGPVTQTTPARRPWLDVDGQAYPLVGSITVIGRGDDADIVLDDPGVSRKHAEIRVTADGPHLVASVRDLGSTNGTFVDTQRITATQLVEGSTIILGRTRAVYRSGER